MTPQQLHNLETYVLRIQQRQRVVKATCKGLAGTVLLSHSTISGALTLDGGNGGDPAMGGGTGGNGANAGDVSADSLYSKFYGLSMVPGAGGAGGGASGTAGTVSGTFLYNETITGGTPTISALISRINGTTY